MKLRRGLLFVLCALAGCHKTGTPTHSVAAVQPPPVSDAAIVDAAKRRFEVDRVLEMEPVHVAVANGVCTLWGSVGDLPAKKRALDDVAVMRGIREIVDRVDVTPVARPDRELAADVKRAVADGAVTVAAHDGRITIAGTVSSWGVAKLDRERATRVRGVKEVVDELAPARVARTDPEITTEVSAVLANDAWLDGTALELDVHDGDVELRGVVASIADRERAAADARVDGVNRVDADAVVVDWERHDAIARTAPRPRPTETDVEAAVRAAFARDPRLAARAPAVSVDRGIVELSGSVFDAAARAAAKRDAWDQIGVFDVDDDIAVEPRRARSDADIERAVANAFGDDMLIPDGSTVRESSAKGKVVLSGDVGTPLARGAAVADVEGVPGVVDVVDHLVLTRSADVIHIDAADRLAWDADVSRGRVSVLVDSDGVATLSGVVDRWSELRAAVRDVRAAGASRVVSHLVLVR